MGKKNIYFVRIGYILRPSYVKLHISRHHLDKEFNFQPRNMFLYQLTKNLAAEIAPHISSGLRDLNLGKIVLLFL